MYAGKMLSQIFLTEGWKHRAYQESTPVSVEDKGDSLY